MRTSCDRATRVADHEAVLQDGGVRLNISKRELVPERKAVEHLRVEEATSMDHATRDTPRPDINDCDADRVSGSVHEETHCLARMGALIHHATGSSVGP
jgi:hypothetical protein